MNKQEISGKWQEIKGEIRNQWSKLTDDDMERVKGDVESIAGLIEQRYGHAKEAAKEKLHELFDKFADKTDDLKNSVKDSEKHH